MRDMRRVRLDNKKKVQKIKNSKADEQMALPITTKQIDGGMLLDADVSTQLSQASINMDHYGSS